MDTTKNHKLLIISNNVLSETKNNGKTVLSYISNIPKECVQQLYFSEEIPEVQGYKYYKISDNDVLKRRIKLKKHNGIIEATDNTQCVPSTNAGVPKSPLMRLLREVIWIGSWKTKYLLSWLDEFSPAVILFVGGDCIFAYRICKFILKRYKTRTTLYITDDYVISYSTDNLPVRFRKLLIRKKLREFLRYTDVFYTISKPMQEAYKELFNKDSHIISNLTESMKTETTGTNNDRITIIYTGSLYYGRDASLGVVSNAAAKINQETGGRKILIKVFSNTAPDDRSKKLFEIPDCCIYAGSLNAEQLKEELNRADILLFIESTKQENVQKTKFSLSTKIPEYLSLGKPIFAVGAKETASIQYLEDAGMCVYNYNDVYDSLLKLLNNEQLRDELSIAAESKFIHNHNKETLQKEFLRNVLGD